MIKTILAAALAAITATTAVAQDYPKGAVSMVLPYAPGGSSDPIARYIATELQNKWGVAVPVENVPGAGATIGTAKVARAAGDGQTLLFHTAAFTTSPVITPSLPYDPVKDLVPVALLGVSPYIVLTGPSTEATTFAAFADEAKQKELFFSTSGLGTSSHFAGELFTAAAALPMTAVHYKGSSEAMLDLIGGRVDVYVGSLSGSLDAIRNGQVKALAIMGDIPAPELPDVPTTATLGIEGANASQWFGLFTSAGTPAATVEKINADVEALVETAAMKEFLARTGTVTRPMNASEFKGFVEAEIAQWQKLADERNIRPE